MARKSAKNSSKSVGRLRQAAEAVKRVFTRKREEPEAVAMEPRVSRIARTPQQQARPTQRQTDIPLDVLDRSYTPQTTSSKASFRSNGADMEKDQEFMPRTASDLWNDEDHYTNKSGDPRIGTHGRTSPREEARTELEAVVWNNRIPVPDRRARPAR